MPFLLGGRVVCVDGGYGGYEEDGGVGYSNSLPFLSHLLPTNPIPFSLISTLPYPHLLSV